MSVRLSDAFEAFKSLIPDDLDPAALQVWKEDGAVILMAEAGERRLGDEPGQDDSIRKLRALRGWDARAEAELVAAAMTAALSRTRRDD